MGRAFYKFKTSIAMNMIDIDNDSQTYVDKYINNILSQLPHKTKLIGVEKNIAEMTLAYSCVAIFEHPIFIDDSEIKDLTEYKRDIGFNADDDPKEHKIYVFDRSDRLNFDEFINKTPPLEDESNDSDSK